MSEFRNDSFEAEDGENLTFDQLVTDVDADDKKSKVFKIIVISIAIIIVALAVVLAGLYSKKKQLNEQMELAAAAEPLMTDSVSWGVKNLSDGTYNVDEESSSESKDSATNTSSDTKTVELIRDVVYEQLKDGIESGTIVINGKDQDGVTEEQLKILTEEITKEVTSSVGSGITDAKISDSQKESIIKEITNQIGNSGLTDSEVRSIVYSTINSLDLKGEKGAAGVSGSAGKDGRDGKDGADGEDGKTPVRGVDYFTSSDIDAMVSRVATEIINNGDITVTAKSAYDIAVDHGFVGTEEEWIASLNGISSSDLETIKETIYSVLNNAYQPYVTQNADGRNVLTIPVAG